MSRATEDLLASLHDALATDLLRRVRSGEASPADLSVVRAFLKDNGIECLPEKSDTMKDLVDSLPDSIDFDMQPTNRIPS